MAGQQQKPAHGRRGSLGFGSNLSEDFEKLLQQHFGGSDDIAASADTSPLFSLTSDGTMLQELLQTLENGGSGTDVAGGRMFSDDTINAIMGEHFRELAADVIRDIREGKDPKEIKDPATVATPALQQAVAAAQLHRKVSSNGSMSLREVQLSMQQVAQQQQAAVAVQQQQQLQTISLAAAAPTTVLVQPQLTVNTARTAATPPAANTPTMMALQQPTISAQQQHTLLDQQQQQPMIAVQGQVVQNADGTQSIMIDPNMAMHAIQQQQQPGTTTTIQHVQVPVQQQQQVMVQVAGANGVMQYVPVLESRIVGYASQPVAVTSNPTPASTSATPPATTPAASQSEAMLAGTQQLMASAVAQQHQLQAFGSGGLGNTFGRLSSESLSRSTSDTAAQAAALANEQQAQMMMNGGAAFVNSSGTVPLPSRVVSLQPAGMSVTDTLPMPMGTSTPGVLTGSPVGFGLLATTTTQPQLTATIDIGGSGGGGGLSSTFPPVPTLQPQQQQQPPMIPHLRPASAPFPIPQQHQHHHVVPQLRPAAEPMVIPGVVLTPENMQGVTNGNGSGGIPVLQATTVVTPTTSPPMTAPTLTAAVVQHEQQQQQRQQFHDAALAALPTKPCHKRERSIRSDNPFLADPTTAPDVKCAKGSPRDGGGGLGELGASPDSALMNGYLAEQCAGVESSSGDASPLAPPENNQTTTDQLSLHMLSFQQQQQHGQNDEAMPQALSNIATVIKQEPTTTSTTTNSTSVHPQRVTRSRTRPVSTRGGLPLVTIPETTDVHGTSPPNNNNMNITATAGGFAQLNGNQTQVGGQAVEEQQGDVDQDMPSIQELIQQTLAPPPGKRRGRPPGTGRHVPDVPGAASEPTDAEILEKLLQEDPRRRLMTPDELKKVMRKEKNRISAAISRHNTQVYTNHLENQVRKLEEERVWYAEALEGQQIQQPPHRVILEGQGTSGLVPKPHVRHVSV